MTSSNRGTSGIGFVGLLAIVFIVLKLCHVIAWAWVWVLSPIWISLGLVLVVLGLLLGCLWTVVAGRFF